MKYLLTLQWDASSPEDFNDLVEMEDALIDALSEPDLVDGHDLGSHEMNIFIATPEPARAFSAAAKVLQRFVAWGQVRAAYRDLSGDSYVILWPPELKAFDVK